MAQLVGWLVVGINKFRREKFAFWLDILALPSHVVIKNTVNHTYHPKDRIYLIYRSYNFIRWILHFDKTAQYILDTSSPPVPTAQHIVW